MRSTPASSGHCKCHKKYVTNVAPPSEAQCYPTALSEKEAAMVRFNLTSGAMKTIYWK